MLKGLSTINIVKGVTQRVVNEAVAASKMLERIRGEIEEKPLSREGKELRRVFDILFDSKIGEKERQSIHDKEPLNALEGKCRGALDEVVQRYEKAIDALKTTKQDAKEKEEPKYSHRNKFDRRLSRKRSHSSLSSTRPHVLKLVPKLTVAKLDSKPDGLGTNIKR